MIPFNHNYFLGYINEVTPIFVKVHFPSSNLLSNFYIYGKNYNGGNVGNFIVIEGDEYGFIARIVEINLPDSERKAMSEKAIEYVGSEFHPSGKAELLCCFNIFEPEITYKTVARYPSIGAKVYSCSDEQISMYIREFGKKEKTSIFVSIGKLTTNNVNCNISLNSFFGRHCAVVGTTGGGKSWTISKLIESVIGNTKNKIILIDATGEYQNITENHAIFGKKTLFSYKYLSNSDFCFLFQEHSPNTIASLCEAIHTLKLINLGLLQDGIKIGKNSDVINNIVRENIHLFKDCNFDITKLATQIKNECVRVGRNGIYEEDNFKLGYTSHLIARINLFLNNEVLCSALGITENPIISNDIINIIESFIKRSNKKTILRIGFENLAYDFSIRELIVDFIASFLLKNARKNKFKKFPLLLFIDEAHQFLNKRINTEEDTVFYLQNIDLIAKECRKYGLFLCLSTQMPRDIPIGTLSQMGTFLVHRLINEQDKRAIENASAATNRNILNFLPILGEGEALLVGVDFPMPLLIKVDAPIHPPISDTPVLTAR